MYKVKGNKYNLSLLSQVNPEMTKNQPVPPRKKHKIGKFV